MSVRDRYPGLRAAVAAAAVARPHAGGVLGTRINRRTSASVIRRSRDILKMILLYFLHRTSIAQIYYCRFRSMLILNNRKN